MREFSEMQPKISICSGSYLIPVTRRPCTAQQSRAHRAWHWWEGWRGALLHPRLVFASSCVSFCACVGGGGGGGIVRIAVRVRVRRPRRSESSLRTPKFHNTIKMKLKPITALLKTIKYHECSRTHFTHVILLRLRMIGNSG